VFLHRFGLIFIFAFLYRKTLIVGKGYVLLPEFNDALDEWFFLTVICWGFGVGARSSDISISFISLYDTAFKKPGLVFQVITSGQ